MGNRPTGYVFGENSFYQDTCGTRRGGVATWPNVVLTPQQRYATGELVKVQGRDCVAIVVGYCGERARGMSIRGKFGSCRQSSGTGPCGNCSG